MPPSGLRISWDRFHFAAAVADQYVTARPQVLQRLVTVHLSRFTIHHGIPVGQDGGARKKCAKAPVIQTSAPHFRRRGLRRNPGARADISE
jgi:hypothetical protein